MSSLRRQSGFTLSKLLMMSVVVGFFALLAMKLIPEYLEYYKVLNNVKAVATEASAKTGVTVADVRMAFTKRAEIDHIKGFSAADLDVSKDGNQIIVEFSYQRKVPLIKNISILIDFEGSSAK